MALSYPVRLSSVMMFCTSASSSSKTFGCASCFIAARIFGFNSSQLGGWLAGVLESGGWPESVLESGYGPEGWTKLSLLKQQ